jgi:FAD dependent oxidoreductase TIGR03364
MARMPSEERFDLAVVGAGILGLATALAAVRRGLRVAVLDRDEQARGASVRNFGFITVTGQEPGIMWARARRTREVWRELASAAGICIAHTGMWMIARRAESLQVIESFMDTEMAEGCRILGVQEARRRCPQLQASNLIGVLESTVELRVDSREAIPRLAKWLSEAHGVRFLRNAPVHAIDPPWVHSSIVRLRAERIAVCTGDEYQGLFAKRFAAYELTRCKLQMLKLANPGFRLPGALMSDLGLARNPGYSNLDAAAALRSRLGLEQPEHLRNGVHLIVVQNTDGTLIVGDSHHYTSTPDEIAYAAIDTLILQEYRAALGMDAPPVLERWVGTYAYATDRSVLIDAPAPAVRLVVVTCGSGASTAFAIGEELVNELF